jgi:hypothetical protein
LEVFVNDGSDTPSYVALLFVGENHFPSVVAFTGKNTDDLFFSVGCLKRESDGEGVGLCEGH